MTEKKFAMSTEKQETYYNNLIKNASNEQKQLFKVVEKVLDKKEERVLPTHTDPVKLANEFNNYYIDKIEKLRQSIPETDASAIDIEQFLSCFFVFSFFHKFCKNSPLRMFSPLLLR